MDDLELILKLVIAPMVGGFLGVILFDFLNNKFKK